LQINTQALQTSGQAWYSDVDVKPFLKRLLKILPFDIPMRRHISLNESLSLGVDNTIVSSASPVNQSFYAITSIRIPISVILSHTEGN